MKPLTEWFFDATEGMVLDADATNYATLTVGGPIEPCGEFFGIRPPRWLRLWQRRHEKAAAKRTKMRTARYAARWEQAHLRDKPAPVDRTERIRRAVGELDALVDAWENSK